MNDIYENIEECNTNKKCKIIIVFDNMILDILSNRKLNRIVSKLFIRDRALNISLVFLSYLTFLCEKC